MAVQADRTSAEDRGGEPTCLHGADVVVIDSYEHGGANVTQQT